MWDTMWAHDQIKLMVYVIKGNRNPQHLEKLHKMLHSYHFESVQKQKQTGNESNRLRKV